MIDDVPPAAERSHTRRFRFLLGMDKMRSSNTSDQNVDTLGVTTGIDAW